MLAAVLDNRDPWIALLHSKQDDVREAWNERPTELWVWRIRRARLRVLRDPRQLLLHGGKKAIRQCGTALFFELGQDVIHITLNTWMKLQLHLGWEGRRNPARNSS